VLPADAEWNPPAGVTATVGGATRSDSVRAGLALVSAAADIIVVHDAARPLASRRLYTSVIDAVATGADAAVPVLPVVDTIKRVHDGRVVETVARADLVAVQTPQAFRAAALRAAHAAGAVDTDDAALVEAAGGSVAVVEGERRNLKLTSPEDLDVMRALVEGARP
jgi:2-C-methyl-D-erythritol 4-phosphate cytidylyltransferase